MGWCEKICSRLSKTKRIGRYFEWPGLVGIFAFISLSYLARKEGYTYFALIVVSVGILFIILASFNSYKNKSTELVDRYEERFFLKMKQERKLAAQYLLKQITNNANLKFVLDYLESPIADKVISGQIEIRPVYNYFRHWISLYWIASQKDIEVYRRKDPGAWPSLKTLFDTITDLEKKDLGSEYKEWTTERIQEALQDEASLV